MRRRGLDRFALWPLLLGLWISISLAPLRTTQAAGPIDREHWAFQPPVRPELPEAARAEWVRGPIDAFILEGLDEFGLAPAPEADRTTLLRRLSFDLIGLPPSPEEIDRFLNDKAPDAYERQVERLLASPRHGERWAQHWLDLARYADSDGFEFDAARPTMWRYRDWVVDALNADLPYDAFVRLQLAGDENAPEDPSASVATGFNRCYPDMVDLNDQGLRRQHALDDITETIGLTFLGVTIGCARCHDHKFDPIRQEEFYQLQAFVAPAEFRDDFPVAVEPESTARVLHESRPEAAPTRVLVRGNFEVKGPEVAPAFPAVLVREGESPIPTIAPMSASTGRRTALAAWLTRPDHPLTARVMVNRLWQHHFGRGLVATPSDFGVLGDPPSHPELLDWLAVELVESGWSLKALHRLMVTSAAYRQSSRFDAQAARIDPDNLLVWRHRRTRLDGEAIRDALLACSGVLDSRVGGPCVFPELPQELTLLSGKGAIWPVSSDPRDRNRRSLYVFTRRNLRYPFFEAFDRPDTNASCPRRSTTTIAPQALSLFNGDLPHASARALADRLAREAGPDPDARIDLAYRLGFGRLPDADERRMIQCFLDASGADRWTLLALALMNSNEFIYVD